MIKNIKIPFAIIGPLLIPLIAIPSASAAEIGPNTKIQNESTVSTQQLQAPSTEYRRGRSYSRRHAVGRRHARSNRGFHRGRSYSRSRGSYSRSRYRGHSYRYNRGHSYRHGYRYNRSHSRHHHRGGYYHRRPYRYGY